MGTRTFSVEDSAFRETLNWLTRLGVTHIAATADFPGIMEGRVWQVTVEGDRVPDGSSAPVFYVEQDATSFCVRCQWPQQ